MQKVEIYTRPGCGYCDHAKAVLKSKNIQFSEYDVYQQHDRFVEMQGRTSNRTYPQIFIDDRCVGGLEELLKFQFN